MLSQKITAWILNNKKTVFQKISNLKYQMEPYKLQIANYKAQPKANKSQKPKSSKVKFKTFHSLTKPWKTKP